MEPKPREIKIWTVLQISLTLLSLITLRHLLLARDATATPDDANMHYSGGGADLIWLFLLFVLVVGFILGIAISFGLWAGKEWTQVWGTVYASFSLLFGVLWIRINVSPIIIGIVYVLVSLPSIYLVTRPRVQGFFKESEMKIAIERVVGTRYSIYTIGITDDPDRRRIEHDDPKPWYQWRADTETIARNVEKHFLAKGMKGAPGGGEHPN